MTTTERFGPILVHDMSLGANDFRRDVITGLTRSRKTLPSKYFYDTEGLGLLERVTRLPEYYLARAEEEIFAREAAVLAELLGPKGVVVEFGGIAAAQTRFLLDSLVPMATDPLYVPVGSSKEKLIEAGIEMRARHPRLRVEAVCAEFTLDFSLPFETCDETRPRGVFLPGSSIGHFSPVEARVLLRRLAAVAGPKGVIAVGVDGKKDRARLEAAYNDAEGVVARFHGHLLERIEREFGVNIPEGTFRHQASYNESDGKIEMRLVCERSFQLRLGAALVRFAPGESILTDCAHQYDEIEFAALAAGAGLRLDRALFDGQGLFGLYLMSPAYPVGFRGSVDEIPSREGRI